MLIFCGSWYSVSHVDPRTALLNLNIGLASSVGSIRPSIAAVHSISLLNSGPQRTYRPIADVGIRFRLIFLWQTAVVVDMVSTSLRQKCHFQPYVREFWLESAHQMECRTASESSLLSHRWKKHGRLVWTRTKKEPRRFRRVSPVGIGQVQRRPYSLWNSR